MEPFAKAAESLFNGDTTDKAFIMTMCLAMIDAKPGHLKLLALSICLGGDIVEQRAKAAERVTGAGPWAR